MSGAAFVPAKRGDLVVVSETAADYVNGVGRTERTTARVGVVTSITREGLVKAALLVGSDTPTVLATRHRTVVCSKNRIDVGAALEVARRHTWPQHDSPMPYSSIDEIREALDVLVRRGDA